MKIREVSVQQINAALNDLTRDIDIKIKQIESLNNEIKNMQSKLEALTKAVNGDFTALDEAIGDNIEYINNNFVPNTRTVNGKALNQNISLTASDVGALPDSTVIPAVVDSVTSGNMNAVTSNAVAGALNPLHIAKNGSIYADGTKANVPIIKMKDNTSDAYGNGIVIGGGGATVIGGGESADTYYSGANLSAGSETMVVANDGTITFVSNLQDGYASRKEMTMGTDGKLSNPQGFVGNVTGNCSGSSGSCTGNAATASSCSGNSASATKAVGTYTGSGGQQNPQYVGKNRVCFNMMNTSVLSDTTYKDWMMMDCYGGHDAGGTTAFGISRTQLRAYIMRANAGTSPNRPTSWAESGEVAIISAKGWNTTSGYIDFSNGLKMQWGVDTSTSNTYKTVTASRMGTKAFFQVIKYDTGGYGQQTNLGIKYVSATSISVDSGYGTGTKSPIFWFAIGY